MNERYNVFSLKRVKIAAEENFLFTLNFFYLESIDKIIYFPYPTYLINIFLLYFNITWFKYYVDYR